MRNKYVKGKKSKVEVEIKYGKKEKVPEGRDDAGTGTVIGLDLFKRFNQGSSIITE